MQQQADARNTQEVIRQDESYYYPQYSTYYAKSRFTADFENQNNNLNNNLENNQEMTTRTTTKKHVTFAVDVVVPMSTQT